MNIIKNSFLQHNKNYDKITLTFGDFDGIHLGHLRILKKLISFSDTKSAIINFIPNSKAFFTKTKESILTPLKQKIIFYKKLGINYLFLWSWSQQLSHLKKEEFIEILKKHNVKRIVTTKETKFGFQNEGNYKDLEKSFELCLIECLLMKNQHKISTHFIKKMLSKGKVEEISDYLGYYYSIEGKVIKAQTLDSALNLTIVNLNYSNYFLPQIGTYVVYVYVKNKKYFGTINVNSDLFIEKKHKKTIEVFIYDLTKNIYKQIIKIEFRFFLRKEKCFLHNIEFLEQVQKDFRKAQKLLKINH